MDGSGAGLLIVGGTFSPAYMADKLSIVCIRPDSRAGPCVAAISNPMWYIAGGDGH
jgi:hypothetical protein